MLQLLLRTQSVSATATALGVSQPAVSDALARLRAMLEDQLLVRVGSRMSLTTYAEGLIDPLDKICGGLEQFLSKDSFDPLTARREFIIATSDIGAYLLALPIVEMLAVEAPHVSLQLIDVAYDITMRMAAREIDMALLPEFAVEDLAPAPLRFRGLTAMRQVILMRRGHPLAELDVVGADDIVNYRHIAFYPDRILKPANRYLMPTNGLAVDYVARMEQTLLIPHMLVGSEFVAIVNEKFAADMVRLLPLASRPLSYATTEVHFGIAWSPVQDRDPGHSWFRNAIGDHFARRSAPAEGSRAIGHRAAGGR